ncbi:MAG: prepilin-type N-terminal cleavage/methylation domain-containing protein [Planctomycetales bacterium]|nr:prepilin-type N-terminal cleavage/methylation domain-containing protein [Planctomycetales bacterium]
MKSVPTMWPDAPRRFPTVRSGHFPITRSGFSLLEVILATAILASSAMVLSSLLGLGTKFGSRAEARTEALSDAESLLAEFLVLSGKQSEREEERTGILNSNPPRAFRIRMEDAAFGGIDAANSGANRSLSASSLSQMNNATSSLPAASQSNSDRSPAPLPSRLVMVTVEVFESSELEMSDDTRVLCQLSQLVRIPPDTGIP